MENSVFFVAFNIVIFALISADFIILRFNNSAKCALFLTIAWIFCGVAFSGCVYLYMGSQSSVDYLSAYFVEKSLSIDNIFIFFIIFSRFNVKKEYQHKLLFIGIWSALIMRLLMIFIVGELLDHFHFMIYVFGASICYAGVHSLAERNQEDKTPAIIANIKKYIPIYEGAHYGRLFVKDKGQTKITILVLVILCIEISDIVFAFDSIPALFSITSDRAIIYTSNAFAIIGLRSLYISFIAMLDKFRYVKQGVSIILLFIGLKMLVSNYIHIDSLTSLILVVFILTSSVVLSIIKMRTSFINK